MHVNNFTPSINNYNNLHTNSTHKNQAEEQTNQSTDSINLSTTASTNNNINITGAITEVNKEVASIQNDFDAVKKHEVFLNKMQSIRDEISKEIYFEDENTQKTIDMSDFNLSSNFAMQNVSRDTSTISLTQEVTQEEKEKINFLQKNFLDEIPLETFNVEYENATPFLNKDQVFESKEQALTFLGRMEAANIDESNLTKEYQNILSKNYFKAFDMTLKISQSPDINQRFYEVSNDIQVASKILGEALNQTSGDNTELIQAQKEIFEDISKKLLELFENDKTDERENILKEVDNLLKKVDSEVISEFLEGHDTNDKYKDVLLQLKEGTFITNIVDKIKDDKDLKLQDLKDSTLNFLSTQKKEQSTSNYENESLNFSKQNVLIETGSLSQIQSDNLIQKQSINLIK